MKAIYNGKELEQCTKGYNEDRKREVGRGKLILKMKGN